MEKNFRLMCDLVADAEDLLLSLEKSTAPEIQVLKAKVQASIDEVIQQVRQEIGESTSIANHEADSVATAVRVKRALAVAAGAAVTAGLVYRLFLSRYSSTRRARARARRADR